MAFLLICLMKFQICFVKKLRKTPPIENKKIKLNVLLLILTKLATEAVNTETTFVRHLC